MICIRRDELSVFSIFSGSQIELVNNNNRELAMRCLVVDDDAFGRELMTGFLTEHAEVVDSARDGAEAVRLFSHALQEGRPYCFVCLDILMPVMNGQDALKQMRALERVSSVGNNK